MKITVIGPGAIGTLLATTMARNGNDISVLVKALQKNQFENGKIILENFNGKRIESRVKITTELENPDWTIIAVKSYDVGNLVDLLKKSQSPVLCCQNGIKTYNQIKEEIGEERMAYMVTGMGSSKVESGRAVFKGSGFTYIGTISGQETSEIQELSYVMNKAGIKCKVVKDIFNYVWLKAIINCSINPVAAYYGVPNGKLEEPELNHKIRNICMETEKIATKTGIKLPLQPWTEIKKIIQNTSENKCSMLQDLENGHRTEIDALNGEIIRIADDNRLDASYNKDIMEKIISLSN
ncbi:MAG: 2-dehydropantoate 2-reductase [Candidatus Thermoplasmatota archaeon]|nr:2-dehydropantoate 2-reductase [Candidatus Thermoplasmatota archaeon]